MMNSPAALRKFVLARWVAAAIALAVVAGVVWRAIPRREPVPTIPQVAVQVPLPPADVVAKSSAPTNHFAPGFSVVQLRPLSVASESGAHQWTRADGKDTNVIRQLAHNGSEFTRMVEENQRIIRRQLVYRKETAAALVQRARLSGEPVHRLTLPGLDGREVQFEITRADLYPSGQQGTFTGRVAGRADSMVTLAFKGGREAFTVISPADGMFLQADPREPGEVIVKSIDPEVYAAGLCGTP